MRLPVLLAGCLFVMGCGRDVATPPAPTDATRGPDALADRTADQPSGTLNICKQAGAGLTAGQVFTFRVTLSGVTRNISVAVGSCSQLEVPRESGPLSKGYYKSNPDAVARLVPTDATLVVDASTLSSAQAEAVLAGSNVTVASSLLLNLAQQLIAADLNVLRGVQPSTEVLQAMSDANAALHVTVVGTQIEITTALTTAQQSALVDLLSSFNERKTKPPAAPAAVDLQIVETVQSLSQVAAIACDQASRCSNIDLASGSVMATVVSGETTVVTYTNKARAVLRVCKVAGPGIEAGTVFHFSAAALGLNSGTTTFDVPAGDCRQAALDPGSYLLHETIPSTAAVSAISCDPANRCGTPVLIDGVVGVSVVDASTTTVTYTNRSTMGTLRVCKVAGVGIEAGTVFRIGAAALGLNFGTTNFDVPAGECREASVKEGSYFLHEVVASGTAVSAISCEPAGVCGAPILVDGVVTTSVTALSTTTVTYTNRSTLGTLRVCKVAGPGITAGTVFRISAAALGLNFGTTNFDVPAGECREAAVNEGTYLLQEAAAAGTIASAISCDPALSCGTPILADGVVSASVTAQSTTTVTYTNRSTIGTLRVCKVAGTGITPGIVYRISASAIGLNFGTTNFDVPAGECREASLTQGPYILQEVMTSGTLVSAISCDPVGSCGTINLVAGVATASVTALSTTTVTYTNSAVPPLEPLVEAQLWSSLGRSSWIVGLGAPY